MMPLRNICLRDCSVILLNENNRKYHNLRNANHTRMKQNGYYIQSAYSLPNAEKKAQEVRPFRKIEDSFKKIIVTKDIIPATYDENGILTINIYDFLLNMDCLEK